LPKKLQTKKKRKGNLSIRFCLSLAFFLFLPILLSSFPPACGAEEQQGYSFPAIMRLNPQDTGFKQYIGDVENNRRLLRLSNAKIERITENLTIYQYTPRHGEDIFTLAARCNIPYSALSSLNRIGNPLSLEPGKPILLPSCPGIFLPANPESDLEKLLGAARSANTEAVELKINRKGESLVFYFFPGADFTPTERAFFLNSGFRFPLRSFRLTSDFGIRANPVTGNILMHQGLDLAAPEGTEVYAVADGIVTDIGFDPIYGNYVIVRHGEKWTSLYGHLQKAETVLRSAVKSTTLIGRVGSTGQSTGPHLHFELHQDGRAIDPAGRLRR
jgi:murein DD-endopeptidase MepM/ murein hydrolase activator NlpD